MSEKQTPCTVRIVASQTCRWGNSSGDGCSVLSRSSMMASRMSAVAALSSNDLCDHTGHKSFLRHLADTWRRSATTETHRREASHAAHTHAHTQNQFSCPTHVPQGSWSLKYDRAPARQAEWQDRFHPKEAASLQRAALGRNLGLALRLTDRSRPTRMLVEQLKRVSQRSSQVDRRASVQAVSHASEGVRHASGAADPAQRDATHLSHARQEQKRTLRQRAQTAAQQTCTARHVSPV